MSDRVFSSSGSKSGVPLSSTEHGVRCCIISQEPSVLPDPKPNLLEPDNIAHTSVVSDQETVNYLVLDPSTDYGVEDTFEDDQSYGVSGTLEVKPPAVLCEETLRDVSTVGEITVTESDATPKKKRRKRRNSPSAVKKERRRLYPEDKHALPFPCPDPDCPSGFHSLIHLSIHVRKRSHRKRSNYPELLKIIENMKPYSNFGSAKVQCPLCPKTRPGKAIFQHMQIWHSSDPNYDSAVTKCNCILKEHRRAQYRKAAANQIRKRRIKKALKHASKGSSSDLQTDSNEPDADVCPYCEKTFSVDGACARHIRLWCLKNPNRRVRYSCSFCPFQTIDHSKFLQHQKAHAVNTGISCPVCGKCFKRHAGFVVHLRRAHPGSVKEGPFKCSVCGKEYKSRKRVNEHFRRVHSKCE